MFRAPARESGLGAFIQLRWDSSQASVAHLPHPVIAYSWDAALKLVAYPVISYKGSTAGSAASGMRSHLFLPLYRKVHFSKKKYADCRGSLSGNIAACDRPPFILSSGV